MRLTADFRGAVMVTRAGLVEAQFAAGQFFS
jgi:hypothetical protein